MHNYLLLHSDCLEDPDLLAAVEGLDGYYNEEDYRGDDDRHDKGDHVDDRKALEYSPDSFREEVGRCLDVLRDPVGLEFVLDELLEYPGFVFTVM